VPAQGSNFVQVLDRFQNVANDLATGQWKQWDHQLAGLGQLLLMLLMPGHPAPLGFLEAARVALGH